MTDRVKHTAGFTLAELMMSIAIILILAAIAIPSIFNAQNNMRMVELNNAAQSIANAAQTQMTAMKVSGTWMAFLDDRAEGSGNFLLRDEARASNILTSLSIDSTVYDGDYVIVFDQDTASVTAVYYTDGKTGFFGQAPATTNAAQTYYEGGGSSDQTARMANDPMIGYYEGTPSGATPEVALRNPVIWVDEETGCLMVQDPNITITDTGTVGTTNTTIYIENKTKGVSFVLSSLCNDTVALAVASSEDATTFLSIVAGDGLSDVLKQVIRGGTAKGNVYSIDLNALSDKVSASKGDTEEEQKLKDDIAQCEAGDDLAVRVSTEDSQKPSVPSKANANIKWPEPVGSLTIMVTNPYSAAVNAEGKVAASEDVEDGNEEANEGVGYTAPAVKAVAVSGGGAVGKNVTDLSEDTTNSLRNTVVNQELVKENNQAGYQSYLGASIAASSVRNDDTFRFQATVGSYTSDGKTHTYQIWELWLKRADNGEMMRVGYLNDNKWEWAKFTQSGVSYDYSPLDNCFTWYDKDNTAYSAIAGKDTDALNIVTVAFNANAFYTVVAEHPGLQLADGDDNAAIYVRTAPKTSEVQTYFNTLAASNTVEGNMLQSSFLSLGTEETSSRGKNTSSTAAREAFEKEFGASSSDVSWVVSNQRTTGFDQGNAFLGDKSFDNVRVYYSISPGVGFQNIKNYDGGTNNRYLTDVRSTQMTNVSLWLYRGASYSDLQVMPAALLQSDGSAAYTCRTANNYDFKLTTQEDYRFYRVLTYEGETAGNIPSQYVPHISADNAEIATIAAAEGYEDDSYLYPFEGWTVAGMDGTLIAGSVVSDYENLSFNGVTLTARYGEKKKVKPSVGMMYIETGFDSAGNVAYGYFGYIEDSADRVENGLLSNEYSLTDGGYYVVVPAGSSTPVVTDRGGLGNANFSTGDLNLKNVTIEDGQYDCYRLLVSEKQVEATRTYDAFKQSNYTLSLKADIFTGSQTVTVNGTYTINLAFACAVETNANKASNWGKSDDSPWIVRLGRQFISNLTTNNVQLKYSSSNYFLQTHDIDLADAPIVGTTKSSQPFNASTYNGSNNKIFGIQYRMSNGESITGEDQGRFGLFRNVTGNSLISNVNLVIEPTEDNAPYEFRSTHTNYFRFGFIASSTEDGGGRIDGCTVSVRDGKKATVKINKNGANGEAYIGGLVGYGSQLVVSDSSVDGVSIIVDSTSAAWGTSPMVGGIVGFGSQLTMSECSVKNASYTLLEPTGGKNIVYFGGLVGRTEQSGVYDNHQSGLILKLAATQKTNLFVRGKSVGGVGTTSSVSGNDSENIVAKFGEPGDNIPDLVITEDVGAS